MKKLIILITICLNLTAYDFGEDVNIIGKWRITSENGAIIFMVSSGFKWEVEFKDDGFIYYIDDGKFAREKWSYAREKGVINIEYYNDGSNNDKMVNGLFSNMTSDNIKIIERLDTEKYLVENLNNGNKLVMTKIGESQATKNTKIKKEIKITVTDRK